jgi:hypothetical protein
MSPKVAISTNDGAEMPAVETAEPKSTENASSSGTSPTTGAPGEIAEKKPVAWPQFLKTATVSEIHERLANEIAQILDANGLDKACCVALLEPLDSIDSYDLDQIFGALNETNAERKKDVVLFLLSRGGAGEPAYQISKLCKSFAHKKFIVVVPRHAKSAATLLAIGADEIHLGPLGQLGPIDPQIDGLPALGVSQALKTIASVAALYPKSAEMFARYLRLALTVEQIGYCDRISESAVQYAERLLSTKPGLVAKAAHIARELVHEYKDHGFVIDLVEARAHLGEDWIMTGTPELKAAEEIYARFDSVNFFLKTGLSRRAVVIGSARMSSSVLLFDSTN